MRDMTAECANNYQDDDKCDGDHCNRNCFSPAPSAEIQKALAAIEKAEAHISDILNGSARFRMSTAVDPDDLAMIIGDAPEKAKALLERQER